MISVEKIDGRISVKFPYNKDYIERIKTIEGYGLDIKKKYWYFPKDDGIVEKILSLFTGKTSVLTPRYGNFTFLKGNLPQESTARKPLNHTFTTTGNSLNSPGKVQRR